MSSNYPSNYSSPSSLADESFSGNNDVIEPTSLNENDTDDLPMSDFNGADDTFDEPEFTDPAEEVKDHTDGVDVSDNDDGIDTSDRRDPGIVDRSVSNKIELTPFAANVY